MKSTNNKNHLINHLVIYRCITCLVIATMFSGCFGTNDAGKMNKQNSGTVVGMTAGALTGAAIGGMSGSNAIVTTALGGMVGGFLGNYVGKKLDDADLAKQKKTYQTALEYNGSGVTSYWQNPDSGHSGSVTPIRTYSANGMYCREYQQQVIVGGKVEQAFGKACRKPDGQWQIMNNE